MEKMEKISLFSGNANPILAKKIAQYLKIPLGKIDARRFSDGETFVEISENVRGSDVFVIQPTCPPANDNLMELLIIIDALKRASADRITAVIPYYGYGRQDRRITSGSPISAKLVADLITIAGASRILTIDLHAGQIEGFFNIPVDNLFAMPVIIKYISRNLQDNLVLVSPDAGGVERTRVYGKKLGARLVIADKRRDKPNKIEEINIIGEVKNCTAVIIDDLVDTGGTLVKVADALAEKGAKKVFAVVTHGVLSGDVLKKLNNSPIKKLIVTDTIPLGNKAKICPKIISLSVAELLGQAIERIHHDDPISDLFI